MDERALPHNGVSGSNELIPIHKLHKYLQLFAPTERMDSSVLSALAELGYEFVVSILEESCQLATLKESKTLEPRDIQFIAENLHDIHIPSTLAVFSGNAEAMDSLSSSITSSMASGSLLARDDAHLRRMAQIRHAVLSNNAQDDGKQK